MQNVLGASAASTALVLCFVWSTLLSGAKTVTVAAQWVRAAINSFGDLASVGLVHFFFFCLFFLTMFA